jgi:hypothetical protein
MENRSYWSPEFAVKVKDAQEYGLAAMEAMEEPWEFLYVFLCMRGLDLMRLGNYLLWVPVSIVLLSSTIGIVAFVLGRSAWQAVVSRFERIEQLLHLNHAPVEKPPFTEVLFNADADEILSYEMKDNPDYRQVWEGLEDLDQAKVEIGEEELQKSRKAGWFSPRKFAKSSKERRRSSVKPPKNAPGNTMESDWPEDNKPEENPAHVKLTTGPYGVPQGGERRTDRYEADYYTGAGVFSMRTRQGEEDLKGAEQWPDDYEDEPWPEDR